MNGSFEDADVRMLAQWIAQAAGFVASFVETREHAHHPVEWRNELNELVLLGRTVMHDPPTGVIAPTARSVLRKAMMDGERQLYYLTFYYLPMRNHSSSSEVM